MSNFTDLQFVGESVIDTAVIPYIRSKNVVFSCVGLKPNTRFYASFDGIDVSAYITPEGGAMGEPLFSTGAGIANGTFTIPNSNSLRFRTGDRVFRIYDILENPQSEARAIYRANGTLQTIQKTFSGTRIVERIVQRFVDPLAQSFYVELDGGAFITSIDLAFGPEAANNEDSVTVQIRDVVNGFPSTNVLSSVTKQASEITGSADASVKTRFTFRSPVFLEKDRDFCFVVMCNSEQLTIWTSFLGDPSYRPGDIIPSGEIVSKQPYLGSMFKSQNNITWTPAQEQDITFVINRAKFRNTSGSVTLRNKISASDATVEGNIYSRNMNYDSFTTVSGSNVISVYHPNHSFTTGDRVYFRKYDDSTLTELRGVPISEVIVEGGLIATVLDFDNYTVQVTTSATSSGKAGGFYNLTASQQTVITNGYLRSNVDTIGGTAVDWSMAMTDNASRSKEPSQSVVINKESSFETPKIVFSDNVDCLSVDAVLTTTSDNLSPVIDLQTTRFIAKANRIDLDELSQYKQRRFSLKTPANKIKVITSVYRPAGSDIEVYYKAATENLPEDWTLMPATEYAPASTSSTDVRDYRFEVSLQEFYNAQIKIVFKSDDISKVPLLHNVRTIALMT